MPAISAGCLVTRDGPEGIEVLLVHRAARPFGGRCSAFRKVWSKTGESLEAAACARPTRRPGCVSASTAPLGSVQQNVRQDRARLLGDGRSPRAQSAVDAQGRCQTPDAENDVCRFYPIDQARALMIPAQRDFLDRLKAVMRSRARS